jgi:antirestriction protein ArdC
MPASTARRRPARRRSDAEIAEARANREAKLAELHEKLNGEIEHLLEDDAWRRMLRVAARFHRYSANNVLLLLTQAEERGIELTRVAGFQAWKKLGRNVRKREDGGQGLAILAPAFCKKRDGEGNPVTDPDTGQDVLIPRFKIEHVWDISQTDGEPLPTVDDDPDLPEGEAPDGLIDALTALIDRAGFTIVYTDDLPAGVHGRTDYSARQVLIANVIDSAATAAILAHELGHIRADHETRRDDQGISRQQRETEADSIAYIVCAARGLDNLSFSAPYVAGWSGGDVKVVQAAYERVQRTSAAILHDVADLLGEHDEAEDALEGDDEGDDAA